MLRTAETFFTLSVLTMLMGVYVFNWKEEEPLDRIKEEE